MRYLLFLLIIAVPGSGLADAKILDFSKKGALALKLETAGPGRFTLSAAVKDTQDVVVSEVPDPARLVFDFIGATAPISEAITPAPNTLVKSVRIGAHPDKVRVVLDLIAAAFPAYQVNKRAADVVILITAAGSGPEPAAPSAPQVQATLEVPPAVPSAPPAQPAAKPTAAFSPMSPSPSRALTQAVSTTSRPPRTTTTTTTKVSTTRRAAASSSTSSTSSSTSTSAAAKAIPSPSATVAVLVAPPTPQSAPSAELVMKEIVFGYDNTDSAPAAKIALTGRTEFKLSRKSDREYLLTISACKPAGDYLTLPQYPPRDFDGFTYLAAAGKNGAIEITVGVDRGTKLNAFAKDNELWLKAAPQ